MIEENIDGWSVIILGFWNSNIFSPGWMGGGRLTSQKEISAELPISNPSLPIRYNFDDIYLQVSERKLVLNPLGSDDEQLQKVEDIALKILKELPHTPIRAVGINFMYIDKEPEPDKLGIFNIDDTDSLSDLNIDIMTTSIIRKLNKEDHIIKLTLSFDERKKSLYDFNFHKTLSSAEEASQYINGNIIKFKNESINILDNIYKQHFEEGVDDDLS